MVIDNVKQATTTTAYANAVKGLSLEQAKLALSTKQLSAIEKEQILIKAGLLNATGKLTTGQLTAILINKERNAEDAKALLLSTGLISAETAEATAVNVVETAKLKELVATKQLTVAEAELIAMKAKVTTANIKEASTTTAVSGKMAGSISILGSSVGSALTKIGSGLLSFASAHPAIAALTTIVGLVGITNSQLKKYEQEQKELIENAKTLQDEYRSFVKSSSDNINSLKAQADEFEELSKGVTKYGENISLSADEYDRYKSIVAEVLGYTPELKEAYDKEGTAIANKNSLIERSIELMKEEQRQKLKEMTTDEKTGVAYEGAKAEWDDANAGYEGVHTRNEIARWFEDNSKSNGWNYEVDVAKILGIKDEWSDEGNNLNNAIINNIDTVAKNIKNKKAELLALEDAKGVALFTEAEIDNMIEKANDWGKAYIEWQQEIEDSKHGMDDQFALYAQRADGYDDLTDAQRAFVNEYIKATGDIVDADGRILSEDEIIEKAESYEKFVDKLATSPEFADARKKINELFVLDSSIIPAGKYEKQVNDILEELQTKFELTDDEVKDFKIALGFDFIDDGNSTRVSELVEKVQGKLKDDFDDKALDLSLDDLIIASNLGVPEGVKLSWEDFIKLLNEAKEIPNKLTIFFSEVFNSSDFSEQKDELLELAKAGELTPETLESTEEYNTLLSQTGLSAESVKDKIYDLLTAQEKLAGTHNGLDSLTNSYKEFKDLGFVTAQTLEDLPDVFKSLEGYDVFSQIVGDPQSGIDTIQQAFNDIVKEYLMLTQVFNSDDLISDDLETQQRAMSTYMANLKEMGVTNAEEVVKQTVSSMKQQQTLLDNAEQEYIDYLTGKNNVDLEYIESTASYNSQFINALGEGYQTDYDNWVNSLAEKKKAYELFSAELEAISLSNDGFKIDQEKLKNGTYSEGQLFAQGLSLSNVVRIMEVQAKYRQARDESDEFKEKLKESFVFNPTFTSDFSPEWNGLDSSSSNTSKSDTYFDWIETKLDKLNDQLDKTKEKAEDTFNGWKVRADAFTDAENQIKSLIATQEKAKARYLEEANKSGLPQPYIDLVKDGAIDIDKLSNDNPLKEQIESYQEWYDKVKECDEAIDELNADLKQLYRDKREFRWEIFDYLEDSISRIIGEADYLVELLSNEDLFDDNGNFNEYGNATLALHASNIETYKQQAKDYLEQMQDLRKELANGGGEDVLNKLNEISDKHVEMIKNVEQEKQSILDLISDGYELQYKWLQKLIDKKKESLNIEKD